jgi:hypothetical protein
MDRMIEIHIDERADRIYVRFHDRGPVYWLDQAGELGQQHQDPGLTPWDEEPDPAPIVAALRTTRLTIAVRDELADILGVGAHELGRAR